MSPPTLKKPLLEKLKGTTTIDPEKREKFHVADGLLVDDVRSWKTFKSLVNSYFNNITDSWIESGDSFVINLIDTFNRLSDRQVEHTGDELLFSKYCSQLENYYKDKTVKKQLINYYCRQELLHRMKYNERMARYQARSTILTLSREQGRLLEGEITSKVSSKRSNDNPEQEQNKRQAVGNTDEVNDENEEREEETLFGEALDDNEREFISEENMTFDNEDSFDSVERHPTCPNYYNFFIEDKKQKWTIDDVESVLWRTENQTNVTKILYAYRTTSYKAAKMMYSISEERILALSFIFVINLDNSEGFLNDCLDKEDEIRSSLDKLTYRLVPDQSLVITNEIDNCRNNQRSISEYMAKLHVEYWDPDLEMSTYYNIINSVSQYNSRLLACHTEQDHNCYEFFTKEVFKDKIYLKHRMSKHLTTCKGYIPDFKLAYTYKHEKVADLFIIEVKKTHKEYTPDNNDIVKINLEMQIMLNELFRLNIEDPVVLGLLIQGDECSLYEMKLQYEAQYITRVIEKFYLPRDSKDITLVPRVTSIFLTIKDRVDDMIEKIKKKNQGNPKNIHLIREGMKMPSLITDPTSHCLKINYDDYLPP